MSRKLVMPRLMRRLISAENHASASVVPSPLGLLKAMTSVEVAEIIDVPAILITTTTPTPVESAICGARTTKGGVCQIKVGRGRPCRYHKS